MSSYWLAHVYFDDKIHQKVALFWFGLRDVGILYSQAVIQRPIVYFPAFLETGLAERLRLVTIYNPRSQQVGGLYAFLYEAAQNFDVVSKIQGQN
jgi:hypothetical protein